MANPYLGEIKLVPYNFAPYGWFFCDGRLLPIDQFGALFTLIGTTYGGDGETTFGLPDLRSRVAISRSGNYPIGNVLGEERVTIDITTMPAHTHGLAVSSNLNTKTAPVGNFASESPAGLGFVYGAFDPTEAETMNLHSVVPAGGNQSHTNLQPYLALNYVICWAGLYPTQ